MAATRQCFYLLVPDLGAARGKIAALSFDGSGADAFATALQAALRNDSLFDRWKALQPEPDAVDPGLAATDPAATVTAKQVDLNCEVRVLTILPHALLKHRMGILIGPNWTLRDVRPA